MRKSSLLLFLLFASHQEISFAQVATTKEEQDYTFAIGLLKDKNYQLAHDQFKSFLKNYPESTRKPEAEFYAASCLMNEESYTDAIIGFTEFHRLHPRHRLAADALFSIAEIYFRREEYSKAQSKYLEVLQQHTDHPLAGEAAYWTGEAALNMNDFNSARKYFTISYETFPNGRLRDYALFSIGYAEEQLKNYDAAREHYVRLPKEFPLSSIIPHANTHVAAVYFEEKNYTATISWIEGLADSPDAENAANRLYYRAEAEYQLGHFTKAEELYSSFLAAYPANTRAREVQYSRGWCFLQQKKYTEAIGVFEQLESGADPIADAARFRKGVALRLNKQTARADDVFQSLIAKSPSGEYTDNALFERGMIYYEKKDFQNASLLFMKIVSEFLQSDLRADTYNMLGESELAAGNYESALQAFGAVGTGTNAAEEITSNALFRRGFTLFQLKKYAAAADNFESFVAQFPHDPRKVEALLWKAEAQFQNEQSTEAANTYTYILNFTQDDNIKQDALYGLGWSYYKQKNYAEAEKIFLTLTKDFRAGKHDVDAHVRLGDTQYAMKQYNDAAATYRYTARMYAKNPLAAYALLQLASVDHRVGNTAAGINTLKALLQKYPGSAYADKAQYNIGWMYFQNKDYAIAISEFQKLQKEFPKSPLRVNAVYSIADACYNQGKFETAEQSYRELIETYPDSQLIPDALNGIAECLKQQGRTKEASEVMIEYMQKHPSSPVADIIALRSADDLYAQKKFEEAARAYKKIITDYPASALLPKAYLQTAQCFYAQNKIDETKKILDEASIKFSNHPVFIDARVFSAKIATEEQQHLRSIEILTELLSLPLASERKAEILFLRAVAYKNMHDVENSKADFTAAATHEASGDYGARAHIQLALRSAQEGSVDEALNSLTTISSSRTDDIGAEAQFYAGQILLDAKRYPESEKELLRVEYVFHESAEWCAKSLLSLGVCYQLQNAAAKARAAYRKVIEKYGGTEAANEAAFRLNRLR